ncbi:MAG: FecR family protein [Sphingomonadales bacterium]
MKNNVLFTADELLLDERFLAWVDGSINDDDNQWINSLIVYSTEQEDEVAEAVSLYRALRLGLQPSDGVLQQQQRLILQLDRLDGQMSRKKIAKGAMVAVLFVGVFAGWLWWNRSSLVPDTEKVMGSVEDSRTLTDGTRIKLAGNSTITLSPGFDDAPQREVWVKGEVEFVVQKKKDKKPFIVHMDPFDVLVTGTAFQVTHLRQRSSVLLREGSVELIFKDGQRLQMSPGDFYAYNRPVIAPNEQPGLVQQGPVLERKIVFEDLTISEVAAQIESRYPVKIIIASADLASRRITGILPNDNLEVLINARQLATESVSKQQGSIIVFTPQ